MRRLPTITVVAAALALSAFTASSLGATIVSGSANLNAAGASVTFQGNTIGAVPDPSLCPSQQADPMNLTCEHFRFTVGAPGDVRVCIDSQDQFGLDDFDFAVFFEPQPGTSVLLQSNISTDDPACLVITCAQPGQYEIRISPFLAIFGDFVGTVELLANSACQPGGGGGAGGGGGTAVNDKMTGGGQTTGSSPQFAINAHVDRKGKVGWSKGGNFCRLVKTVIEMADFNRPAETVHLRGRGQIDGVTVHFTVDADDNGEPDFNDQFVITFDERSDCNGGGSVVSGNLQYHPQAT